MVALQFLAEAHQKRGMLGRAGQWEGNRGPEEAGGTKETVVRFKSGVPERGLFRGERVDSYTQEPKSPSSPGTRDPSEPNHLEAQQGQGGLSGKDPALNASLLSAQRAKTTSPCLKAGEVD